MIGHLLNRTLAVWRPEKASDGMGGQTATFTEVGEVRAKVDQPSVEERAVGQQWEAKHSHNIYLLPSADVVRGDELRGAGQSFRVLSTPSDSHSTYTKCPASELREFEPS